MSDINIKYFSFATFFPSFTIRELLHDLDVASESVADEHNCLQSCNKFGYLATISQKRSSAWGLAAVFQDREGKPQLMYLN